MSCVLKRILQFKEAIVFGPIQIFDESNNDVTNTCMFSWSTDGVCWTSMVDYNSYLKIAKNIETDFYLRISIITTIGKVSVNGIDTACYTICNDTTNIFLEDFCGQANLFNPYANLDCALFLQQQLSNSVICMFGIPVYYFKVKPTRTTADYTFKEYVLHNVESVKQIQLIVPDGQMPSSKPQFSDMDFDWEVDWECEIGKSQFATAFGDTEFPKQRDFVYIPMMKRMWEVNSAYDEKNEGLMWRPTTWKLGLVKWQDKTNVDYSNFDTIIDNLVVNTYDNVFSELELNEESRTTATAQASSPTYTASNIDNIYLSDYIRKQMTKSSITIADKQFNNKSAIVAKNIYTFNSIDSMINYQKGYCGESGVLSFILCTNGYSSDELSSIISFGNINIKTNGKIIKIGDASDSLLKTWTSKTSSGTYDTYMVICRWDRLTYTTEIHSYPYVIPQDIPAYKINPAMNYFNFIPANEANNTASYNDDFITEKSAEVVVRAYPYSITNIKLYNAYLSEEESIKESCKYTTTHKSCVINDVARKINSGQGYNVK